MITKQKQIIQLFSHKKRFTWKYLCLRGNILGKEIKQK